MSRGLPEGINDQPCSDIQHEKDSSIEDNPPPPKMTCGSLNKLSNAGNDAGPRDSHAESSLECENGSVKFADDFLKAIGLYLGRIGRDLTNKGELLIKEQLYTLIKHHTEPSESSGDDQLDALFQDLISESANSDLNELEEYLQKWKAEPLTADIILKARCLNDSIGHAQRNSTEQKSFLDGKLPIDPSSLKNDKNEAANLLNKIVTDTWIKEFAKGTNSTQRNFLKFFNTNAKTKISSEGLIWDEAFLADYIKIQLSKHLPRIFCTYIDAKIKSVTKFPFFEALDREIKNEFAPKGTVGPVALAVVENLVKKCEREQQSEKGKKAVLDMFPDIRACFYTYLLHEIGSCPKPTCFKNSADLCSLAIKAVYIPYYLARVDDKENIIKKVTKKAAKQALPFHRKNEFISGGHEETVKEDQLRKKIKRSPDAEVLETSQDVTLDYLNMSLHAYKY